MVSEPRDIAMVQEHDGKVVIHEANCPVARRAAADGFPVFTMFGCERPAPKEYPRHTCMKEQ